MKKSRTIRLENDFKVKITVKETADNYNQFASIFRGDEKLPLFGTCFKNSNTNEKIINWANDRIQAPHNKSLFKIK